jgi:hypothetical protein
MRLLAGDHGSIPALAGARLTAGRRFCPAKRDFVHSKALGGVKSNCVRLPQVSLSRFATRGPTSTSIKLPGCNNIYPGTKAPAGTLGFRYRLALPVGNHIRRQWRSRQWR